MSNGVLVDKKARRRAAGHVVFKWSTIKYQALKAMSTRSKSSLPDLKGIESEPLNW